MPRTFPANIQPAALLLAALFFSIATACLASQFACWLALAIAAALFVFCRKNAVNGLKRLSAANLFILFIWLFAPFTTPGQPVWQFSFLSASQEGVVLCLLLTIKANAILLVFLSLLSQLNMFQAGQALSALKCPARLVWLFILMDQNVHVLKKEWLRLQTAAKLRGFSPRASRHAYAVIGALLGLLLIRAHDRGKTMREAMLLAGYNGKLPFASTWRPRKADMIVMLLFIMISATLLWVNVYMD